MEIVWTGLNSLRSGDIRLTGYSNIWMLLVYGLAVLLEPLHDTIRGWNFIARGVIWVVLIWGMEYSTGLLFHTLLGIYPWLYSDALAVDGLVTLSYAPVWFIAGMVFERIHNILDSYQVV